MIRHFLLAAAVVMNLAGCAPIAAPGRDPFPGSSSEAFPHRVATSEVVLRWICLQPEAGLLRLEGVAQSPWAAQPIGFLEFDLVGVNAREQVTVQTTGLARDIQLTTNQFTPFHLDLKTTGAEVRFDLYYRYRFLQFFDGKARDGKLAGPPVAGSYPYLLAQTNSYLARDVCAAHSRTNAEVMIGRTVGYARFRMRAMFPPASPSRGDLNASPGTATAGRRGSLPDGKASS